MNWKYFIIVFAYCQIAFSMYATDLSTVFCDRFMIFDVERDSVRTLNLVPLQAEDSLSIASSIVMRKGQPHDWLILENEVHVLFWNEVRIYTITEDMNIRLTDSLQVEPGPKRFVLDEANVLIYVISKLQPKSWAIRNENGSRTIAAVEGKTGIDLNKARENASIYTGIRMMGDTVSFNRNGVVVDDTVYLAGTMMSPNLEGTILYDKVLTRRKGYDGVIDSMLLLGTSVETIR